MADAYNQTKIVATIGPASESPEIMEKLIDAGVNIFRFNTKHSTPEWHGDHIKQAQKIADTKKITLGILLDLQGPEIRLETRNKADVCVKLGQELTIGQAFVKGIDVVIPHAQVFKLVKTGQDLLIDNGFVETKVIAATDRELIVKVKNDAVIKHRKGVNLPGLDIDFPSLIENDIKQITMNARNKVDYVGLSFVRSGKDIKLLRAEMDKEDMQARIVAKIESQPALDRIDEIIAASDAVMVARGDLGVEVPLEQLAYWQKTIIEKCRRENKPVITATQMLESMINNPRPTRAEATDVAHAIFDGTDAIMLSAESASGLYPVRTVETMARIAKWNEKLRDQENLSFARSDATTTIAEAAVSIVQSGVKPKIDAMVVFTETGFTAAAISRYRLPIPVIAVTDNQKTAESLTLSFAVTPIVAQFPSGPFTTAEHILADLSQRSILHHGDTILVVHGYHWQKPGNTNTITLTTT
ncbi:MAG: pyruvate kinase [bacterium]